MFGKNKIMKQELGDGKSLGVVEGSPFYTVQGEGPYAGWPAVFVRLTGCNLSCWFCFGIDVKGEIPFVTMRDGPSKRLDKLVVGDVLLTINDDHLVETTVTDTARRKVTEWLHLTVEGKRYSVTPEHPFFTNRGIVEAQHLVAGDQVLHTTSSDIISWKKMGDRNPMKNPATAKLVHSKLDYVGMGKKISKTRIERGLGWPPMSKAAERTGSGNPNWNPNSPNRNFYNLKKAVELGSCVCVQCGAGRSTKTWALKVHHKDFNSDNDNIENLEVLCKSCHSRVHQNGYNFWRSKRSDGKVLHNGMNVDSVVWVRGSDLQVANISCSPHNTFLADQMLVHNCDTNFDTGLPTDVSVLVDRVVRCFPATNKQRLVVITGGEPLRQNIVPLCSILMHAGYRVQIETAGTLWLDGIEKCAEIVVSPKTPSINLEVMRHATAFKYVVSASDNFHKFIPVTSSQNKNHVATILASPPPGFKEVYLSPMDEYTSVKNSANRDKVLELALRYGCIAGPQLHKIFNIDEPV